MRPTRVAFYGVLLNHPGNVIIWETRKGGIQSLAVDLCRVRQLPYLTRQNYSNEVLHLLPWGLLAGMVEGNISAVVAAKTFHASTTLITVVSTTPVAAHLASLLWGMLCVGRRKLRISTVAASGVVLFVATVGLTPQTPWGGWLFTAQMALAQFFMTGVVTARSALWKSNYPFSDRGRIIARLQALRAVLGVVVLAVTSSVFDYTSAAYRFIYPLAAALGVVGVVLMQRIRVRGERRELRPRSAGNGLPLNGVWVEPFSLTAVLSPGHVLANAVRILREDRRFRKYCAAQSLLGMSALMMRTVMVVLLADRLLVDMKPFYFISVVLLDVLPRMLMIVSMPRWGRLFDRIEVVRFRVANGAAWGLSLVVGTVTAGGLLQAESIGPMAVPLAVFGFAMQSILQGAAQGGSSLAWHIGHLHFARPEEAEVYMGIHVSLTGLRGLIMPSVGILLYQGIGWWVWPTAVMLNLLALAGYTSLARVEARARAEATASLATDNPLL